VRLLPRDRSLGYLWLVYLGLFLMTPLLRRAGAAEWAATAAALLVFLPLYFRAHWLEGPRLYPIIAGIAVLGPLFIWRNPGASAFFIYAGAFTGHAGGPRVAARLLAGLVGLLAVCVFAMHLPPQVWVAPAVLTPMLGVVSIRQAQTRRADAHLRAAREEIEQTAQVAERERIARDLHDLLGHSLSLIALKSELAAKLAERDPVRAAAEIREVEQVSRQALAEVRVAVRGYRSLGLGAELARAQKVLESAGLTVTVSAPDPAPLAPAQETVLALALREAITNVLRHAQARHCRIALDEGEGRVCLRVEDDGRGSAPEIREGFGLTSMRARIEALGGRLERDGGGGGMRLSISLPAPGRPS
jgi:two-component system sensor histidine kinase DesK